MKEGFDFRQIFTFKKKRHLSFIFVVLFLIGFVAVKFGVAWELSRREQAEMPVLALNTLITDLRQYRTSKRQFPASFEQLDGEIWNKNGRSKNLIGKRVFSSDNYVYYYSSDGAFCSVWAIPQGVHRETSETVFVLLNEANQEVWRGRALSDQQKAFIPGVVRPPLALMAQFNMTKDPLEQKETKSGSIFDFFNFSPKSK